MGETNKQVRVDNWGIFFLQRLQLFFNRTDYCDLTLQFEGNVQLKVHRLVMNACTEYFNILEQTCEVVDGNTIIMPDDLQADVILPIVNFMYTGMLEFQMSIFDKLYRTADIMNIPILTKLLDAQKKPITPLPKSQYKKPQPTWNLHGKKSTPKVENDSPVSLPGRKFPGWKRKGTPVSSPATTATPYYSEPKKTTQDPLALFDNTPKPTRFEWPEDEINSTFNLMENSSFDDISYTSKPLLTQDDELRASTSFDDIKYSPSLNKKTKEYSQSIDMEEVKSYVKEQKIRSDMVEYEDEDDPDNYLESVNLDKDNNKRKAIAPVSPVHTKKVRFSVNEKENKEAKINVTATGKTQEMDHTKIISEVLKKYPQLVRKNKNIRLKILAKTPTKVELPKPNQNIKLSTSKVKVQVASPKGSPRIASMTSATKLNAVDMSKNQDEGPWICNKCSSNDEPVEFVLYYLYRKHMTDVHHEKFDSRMCKFCGHQSSKHNMLMYHQYTKHGIKPPAAYIFPKCNRCPYIALTENLLIKHKLNHTKFDLQCMECKVAFNNQASLSSHMQITGHTGKSGRHNYDCQYCTKRAGSGSNLFSHIKMLHLDEARRDGVVSIDEKDEIEEDQMEDETDEYIVPAAEEHKEKIKILSDIKVPASGGESANRAIGQTSTTTSQTRVTTTSSGMENVAGGIATSLGLVDIVVLDENQQYILHNDQQLVAQQTLTNEQREYIIPEISEQHTFAQEQNINEVITSEHNVITQSILNNSDIASTDELVMVLTDHDYNDGNNEILSNENSNIVVLYSHPVDGQQNQFITSQGNLMLNSQTGMLEIRNNDAHSMDNSQDAQIESIEMIQREINSHNIMNTTHTESTVPSDQGFEHSLEENTVLLDNNQYVPDTCVIETKQPEQEAPVDTSTEEIDVDRMISLNKNGNVEEEMPEHVLVLNDCLSNQQEEPMEIDEECTVQDNQNENQNVLQETTEAQVTAPIEDQEMMSKSMPSIDDAIETTENEQRQADIIPTEQEIIEDVSEGIANLTEFHKDEPVAEEASATVETVLEHADQCNAESTQIVDEVMMESETQPLEQANTDLEIQHTDEIISEQMTGAHAIEDSAIATTEGHIINDGAEGEHDQHVEVDQVENKIKMDVESVEGVAGEPTEVAARDSPQILASEENNDVTASPHVETDVAHEVTHELTPESNVDNLVTEEHTFLHRENTSNDNNEHVTEEVTQHVEEIVQHVEEMVETEEVVLDNKNETDQTEHEQDLSHIQSDVTEVEEGATEMEEVTHPQMEVQSQEEIHTEMEETSSFMEINLQTEEVSLQTAETPSQIDDNSVQNESADETSKDDSKFHEETSQTRDKINIEEQMMEDVSSVGENSQSQDSQTSQCSSKQDEIIREFKKTTSQATKISILNDWEDTEDSQQSDQVSKKAELTVNKLIHDWDDDDEEGRESDS